MWTASACSAGGIPGEDQDGVERCDNIDDCDKPPNSQWDVECVHADGQDASSPKVCAPKFREVSCRPSIHESLETKYADATETNGVYIGCDTTLHAGEQGCAPHANGECSSGLEVNVFGVCDDPAAEYPAIGANGDRAGLDVLDQFCRNYFCDRDWMCDASSGTPICRPCRNANENEGTSLGTGACAELWVRDGTGKAVRSSVYVDEVSCSSESGLDRDANTAIRIAAEKVGDVPASP